MKNAVTIWFFASLLFLFAEHLHAQIDTAEAGTHVEQTLPDSYPNFTLLRDTLYVLDSVYLEVRLDEQAIYQHFRDGRVKRYLCSTGNPRLQDAIATREGIFSVQWKSKRYMSRQFQVWLNYWMPFDGGIGFHGLDGRSYYRHLGRRPSSHGCVRISNETGKALFSSIPNGSIVYVHSGAPARILQFADSTHHDLVMITTEHDDLLATRLEAVHKRRAVDSCLQQRMALPTGRKTFSKIHVGRAKGLAPIQYPIEPARVPLLTEMPQPIEEPTRSHRATLPEIRSEGNDTVSSAVPL